MKREYTKPLIMFEDFSLSTNIAAGCGLKTQLPSPNMEYGCGYQIRGAVVFITEANGCTYVEADGDYNGICYHVPTDDNNLFNS